MRIVALLIPAFFLVSCAAGDPIEAVPVANGNMNAAHMRCLSKGNARGTYDYDVCYRNSPEVQDWERRARMNNMDIINKNRSAKAYQYGRSYPVE